MRIPLFNRLKKSIHRKIALLQDEVVDIVYSISPQAVLHGGIAIWRCYAGNRFSEDLDFYLVPEKFKEAFLSKLESRGLQLLKYKKTENTIYSKISDGEVEIRFEAALRKIKKNFVVKAYEKVDGTFMDVFVLSPEDLLLEKIEAYASRKLIRDFYDVYALSAFPLKASVKKKLGQFIKKAEKPLDEKTLKALVFSGAIPSFEQMLNVLKRRC